MRYLIEMRADVNARTRLGQTPLHRAVWGLHIDCINALLSAGCDMNAQDNSGNTPLHLLAINAKNRIEIAFIDRTLQVIKMVVKLDSEMLQKRKSGIMKAVRQSFANLGIKRDDLIIALIANYSAVEGANLRTKNNQHVSAYGIAARLANKQRCSRKIARALHP
jgi:ankyrin repeat protein